MAEHIKIFFDVVEKLNEVDVPLGSGQSELLSIILLTSLQKAYENFVVAIESRDTLPHVDALKTKLLEEGRRREGDEERASVKKAFYLNNRSRKETARSTNDKRNQIKCFNCRKKGHIAAECREKKKTKTHEDKTQASTKSAHCSYPAVLCSTNALLNKHIWVLDSGSTSHMCCDRDLFSSVVPYKETIFLAPNKSVECAGIGSVVLRTQP